MSVTLASGSYHNNINVRMKGTLCRKKIIIGNISQALTPNESTSNDQQKLHRWAIYLRPTRKDEDLSYIKKVSFLLHDSFENPLRVVDAPPFEVVEIGWGEFDIKITIYFVDGNEKPLEIMHALKLFPDVPFHNVAAIQDGITSSDNAASVKTANNLQSNPSTSSGFVPDFPNLFSSPPMKKSIEPPVISEHIDELLFYEPREKFYSILTLPSIPKPSLTLPSSISSTASRQQQQFVSNISEFNTMNAVGDAGVKISTYNQILTSSGSGSDDMMAIDTTTSAISEVHCERDLTFQKEIDNLGIQVDEQAELEKYMKVMSELDKDLKELEDRMDKASKEIELMVSHKSM